MRNLIKNDTNGLINRNRVKNVGNKLIVTSGAREGDKLGDWDWQTDINVDKQTIEDLLNTTGKSTQYSVMTYTGKESLKKCRNMYTWLTLLYIWN